MTYARTAAYVPFTKESVDALRKDFLTLMKSVERVETYEDALKLDEAVKTFSGHYKEVVYEQLYEHVYDAIQPGYYQEGTLEKSKELQRWLGKECWDLRINLGMPFESVDRAAKWDRPTTKEWALQKFLQERPKWLAKVRRAAVKAWKALYAYVDQVKYQGRGDPPKIEVPEDIPHEMEGFKVRLVGWDEDKQYLTDFEMIRESLRRYRKRAAQVFPWMLHHMLPLVVNFSAGLDEGGSYHTSYIELSGHSAKTPERLTQIIAHEMGHHIFQSYLSTAQREYWSTAVWGDYGDLDIAELLQKWPAGAHDCYDVEQKLIESDPILSLQIGAATTERSGNEVIRDNTKREDLERMQAEGVKAIRVPSHPITTYAGKNPEEAFCETIGVIFAWGPRGVHDVVRGWLHAILPEVRVASKHRVVARWFDALAV